jgi:hypothetical protein
MLPNSASLRDSRKTTIQKSLNDACSRNKFTLSIFPSHVFVLPLNDFVLTVQEWWKAARDFAKTGTKVETEIKKPQLCKF